MQIARNWRLRAQRYRFQGFRQQNGDLNLLRRRQIAAPRPLPAGVAQHQGAATG